MSADSVRRTTRSRERACSASNAMSATEVARDTRVREEPARLTKSPEPAPALDPCTFFIISLGGRNVLPTPSLFRSGIRTSRSGFERSLFRAAACSSAGVAVRESLGLEEGPGEGDADMLGGAGVAVRGLRRVRSP